MTKKRRNYPSAEEILGRPWCYYCERDFDDLKILISHQKAKHYKCDKCGRRLNTAGGLSVHLNQVHKENLTQVENALPNRAEPNIEIFGMEGIPDDIAQQHRQRVLQAYYEAESERRRATGNPPPGGGPNAGGHKKPKVESIEELKARLAKWKAIKAAGGDMTMIDVGSNTTGPETPDTTDHGMGATQQQQQQPQVVYPGHGIPSPGSIPQPFTQPGFSIPSQQQPFAPGQPPFAQGPPGFALPGQPFPAFSPPGQMPFQPPQAFGVGSPPPLPFPPAQNGSVLARPPSLPAAPGLPQRPTFGAPPGQQMPQLQQGQPSAPPLAAPPGISTDPRRRSQDTATAQPPTITSASVDSLISSITAEAPAPPDTTKRRADPSDPTSTTESAPPEKKPKKEKDRDRAMKLIYSDNEVSPEEKMARLEKYAFDPKERKEETVLGEVEAGATGTVRGLGDAVDIEE